MAPHVFPCIIWQPRAQDEVQVKKQNDGAQNNNQVGEHSNADELVDDSTSNGSGSSINETLINGKSNCATIDRINVNVKQANAEQLDGHHGDDNHGHHTHANDRDQINGERAGSAKVEGNHGSETLASGTHVNGNHINNPTDPGETVPNATAKVQGSTPTIRNEITHGEMTPEDYIIKCLERFFKGEGPFFKGDGPVDDLCQLCDEPASDQRCGNCRVALYCSRECQAKDHAMHKHICEDMNRFSEARRPSGLHFRAVLFPLYGEKPELIWVQHAKGSGTITVDHPDLDRFAQELGHETIPLHMTYCGFMPYSLLFKDRKMDHGVAILSVKPNPVLEDPKYLNKTISDLGKPGLLDPVFGPLIQVSLTVEEAGLGRKDKKKRQKKVRQQRVTEEKRAEKERRKVEEEEQKREEEARNAEAKKGNAMGTTKKKNVKQKNKGKQSAQHGSSEAGPSKPTAPAKKSNEPRAGASTQALTEALTSTMARVDIIDDTPDEPTDQTPVHTLNTENLIKNPARLHQQMGSLASAMKVLVAIEQQLLQGLTAAERLRQDEKRDLAAVAKSLEDVKKEVDKATVNVLADLRDNPLNVVHSSLRDYRTFIYYIQNRRINPCVHDPYSVPCTVVPALRIVDVNDPFNRAMGLTEPTDRVFVRVHHVNPAMVLTLAFLVGLPWYIRDGNTLEHVARPWQGMDLRFFSRVTVCLPEKGGLVDENGQALKEYCAQTYDMAYSGFFVLLHNRDAPILEHHVLAFTKYLQFCVEGRLVPSKKDFQKYWNAYKAVKVQHGVSMDGMHSPYAMDDIPSEGRDKDADMLMKQLCDDEDVWYNAVDGTPAARYMYKPYEEWRMENLGEVAVRTVARRRSNTASS
ncbi:hypothetical protein DL546_006097 [Coniochaeta pulveracea]|uniref:MYND-type domain-containing protein n=1 Tax=Coniochaeta pulveracea TaxID=177199 RepID=A0A420Y7D6_9PEZI|nr:hypothetical protein DL546_006097 [Coniochaeta pulveracea]